MKGVKTLITIYKGLKNLAERNNTINALVIAAKVACKSIDFIDVTPDYQTCKHKDNACTDKPREKIISFKILRGQYHPHHKLKVYRDSMNNGVSLYISEIGILGTTSLIVRL